MSVLLSLSPQGRTSMAIGVVCPLHVTHLHCYFSQLWSHEFSTGTLPKAMFLTLPCDSPKPSTAGSYRLPFILLTLPTPDTETTIPYHVPSHTQFLPYSTHYDRFKPLLSEIQVFSLQYLALLSFIGSVD